MGNQNTAKVVVKPCEEQDRYDLVVRGVSQMRQMPHSQARVAGVLERFAESILVEPNRVSFDPDKDVLYISRLPLFQIYFICANQAARGRYPHSVDVSRLPQCAARTRIMKIYHETNTVVYENR